MKPNDVETDTPSADDPREPYEAPRLETEELFEVLALACGKVQPNRLSCIRFSRTS
jgi:hypothetical protein